MFADDLFDKRVYPPNSDIGAIRYPDGTPVCSCHRPIEWEYKTLNSEVADLKTLGADKWELISVVPHKVPGLNILYFKRPKVSE